MESKRTTETSKITPEKTAYRSGPNSPRIHDPHNLSSSQTISYTVDPVNHLVTCAVRP
jgi:hypothetical protein